MAIPNEEYDFIIRGINEVIEAYYKYQNSIYSYSLYVIALYNVGHL